MNNLLADKLHSSKAGALEILPKPFVVSMKTLFDILDEQHTGYVKFSDIEKGWQDDGSKELPHGVIDSLRTITPANGLLTFERFCAGLRLCLLRCQKQTFQTGLATNKSSLVNSVKMKSALKPSVLSDTTSHNIENPKLHKSWLENFNSQEKTLDLMQLNPEFKAQLNVPSVYAVKSAYNTISPPPKPPRASAIISNNTGNKRNSTIGDNPTLQNWQLGLLCSVNDEKETNFTQRCDYRGSADGGSSSATDSGNFVNTSTKKPIIKRREPRRHTLQNGIDYNMLKRLKQYEEEGEILLLGLDAVNKARKWYMQQLINVQEKGKHLACISSSIHLEQWSDVQEERLNFQRSRVLEVNRCLSSLPDTWERSGFPLHFNLAIRAPTKGGTQRSTDSNSIANVNDRLRQQNCLLNSEVHLKSERIAMLELEKQTLLAELFDLKQCKTLTRHSDCYLNNLSQTSPVCSSSSGGLGDADVVY